MVTRHLTITLLFVFIAIATMGGAVEVMETVEKPRSLLSEVLSTIAGNITLP